MAEPVHVPIFFSQRLLVACLAFLGTLMVYVTRVNLSVAIICMVRSTPMSSTSVNHSETNVTNVTGQCPGDDGPSQAAGTDIKAEFDWDQQTRAELLSMYFYGYVITQILSGWLASRYGGTRVWGWSMMVCGVCTLLTPVCARTDVHLMYAARFIVGLSSKIFLAYHKLLTAFTKGVSFPCTQVILAQWAPVLEKSKLLSIAYAGLIAGNIVTFSLSGLMCQYGFDSGWGAIFYLSGLFTVLWSIAWLTLTADTPAKHRWISEKEKVYIEAAIGQGGIKKVKHIPWLKIWTSGPVWAIVIAHFCNNYVNYTLITLLPTFLKESMNFDVKRNGLLSSLPYVCEFFSCLLAGFVSDTIREKRIMSTTMVRKSFQCFAFLGVTACMLGVAQITCELRHIAVVLLCINAVCMSFNRAGFVVNYQDISPGYAGITYGIGNTAGTIPGMIAPLIAGALTPNRTTEEWRNVFYVCAGTAVLGSLVFALLADGELQEWAVPRETKIKLDIVAQHTDSKNEMVILPEQTTEITDQAKLHTMKKL